VTSGLSAKSRILQGIRDDENLLRSNGMGTEGYLPRRFGHIESITRFEPLTLAVNEANKRYRYLRIDAAKRVIRSKRSSGGVSSMPRS
jgi:hypothetical protein